jgi:hypothetical protein
MAHSKQNAQVLVCLSVTKWHNTTSQTFAKRRSVCNWKPIQTLDCYTKVGWLLRITHAVASRGSSVV